MKKTLFVVFLAVIAMVAMYGTSYAAMSGTCSTCHTMHNSQGGATMNGQATPLPNLLRDSCCACHGASGPAAAPDVTAGTLAGGDFTAVDANTHNPACDIGGAGTDATLSNTPPGGTALTSQLGCSGTDGCHGTPSAAQDTISGYHHTPPAGMFRFLYANSAGTNIVTGEPSTTWDDTAAQHSIYASDATYGISTFCARCHGNFHGTGNTGSGSPFTRHPTENGVTGDSATVVGDYTATPWAFAIADFTAVSPTTAYTTATGLGKVMCLSCHRAHGAASAWPDNLRFDYTAINVGDTTNDGGCENCHYSKR